MSFSEIIYPQAAPPEFGDHRTCRTLFNLSRSALYTLAAEGKIRSVSLPLSGRKRGRRLFDCASIRRHLNSLAQAGQPLPPSF